MTRYTSFAVVGAGLIGLPVVEALSRKSVSLVVLTRPGSSPKTLPANVKVATVDLNDQAAVTKVFEEHKVEVVISTVGYPGLASQKILADAAKATGVKLFAPSEFGMPTEGFTEGVLGIKNDVAGQYIASPLDPVLSKELTAEHLRSIDLPSVRFYVRPPAPRIYVSRLTIWTDGILHPPRSLRRGFQCQRKDQRGWEE